MQSYEIFVLDQADRVIEHSFHEIRPEMLEKWAEAALINSYNRDGLRLFICPVR